MIQNKFNRLSYFAVPALVGVGVFLGILLSKTPTPANAQVIWPPAGQNWAIQSSSDRLCWVLSPQGKLFQVFKNERQNSLQVLSSIDLSGM